MRTINGLNVEVCKPNDVQMRIAIKTMRSIAQTWTINGVALPDVTAPASTIQASIQQSLGQLVEWLIDNPDLEHKED